MRGPQRLPKVQLQLATTDPGMPKRRGKDRFHQTEHPERLGIRVIERLPTTIIPYLTLPCSKLAVSYYVLMEY